MNNNCRRNFLDAFAEYYYLKNTKNKQLTYQEIQDLEIKQIEATSTDAFIWLGSPGRFIGPKGKNWDNCLNFIRDQLGKPNFQFKIFEINPLINEILWNVDEEELYEEELKTIYEEYEDDFYNSYMPPDNNDDSSII